MSKSLNVNSVIESEEQTALRAAVSPVVISRFEHTVGDDADFVLRGGLKVAP